MGTHPIFESDFDCLTVLKKARTRHTSIVRGANALVEASTKTFTSGVSIVNLPAAGVTSHVSISLAAGARNESGANVGAAGFTRNTLGASNFRNTAFLQNKMVNLMGASMSTSGTRERTVLSVCAGPKAIEELALDVMLPSILQPVFFKWEMTQAWESAKNQAECPVSEAFHANSFKGGLANNVAFKGGYGDENPFFYSEREEALEILAKDFHQANYGSAGAVIVGSGVSDELLEKIAAQLQLNTYGNASNSADGFRAGELRIRKQGNSVAVIGASVGGQVHNYSDVQALSFAASSAADLEAKLASLGAVDVASARANAALSNALKLGGGDAAAVKAVAEGAAIVDVAGAVDADVQAVAAAIAAGAKSLTVIGDTGAFPLQSDLKMMSALFPLSSTTIYY